MPVKKLIFKVLLLLLTAGALLHAGGQAYKRTTAWENLERTENTEKFRDMPEIIDVAAFGPSHGRDAFQSAPEGSVLFNFCLSSQTPEYDLRLMRQYQDHIRPGALVLLTLSPIYPFYLQTEEGFDALQTRYYRILSPWNIADPDWSYALRLRLSPLLTEDFSKIAAAFLRPETLKPTWDQRSGEWQLQPEDIPQEQERIHKNHLDMDTLAFPEESPAMAEAYREMLALCREKGWKAVLVTPPYPAEYCACFDGYSPDFFPVLERFALGLCRDWDTVWLDYSHDPAFARRHDLFRNIDHLNLEGAALFNGLLYSDIRSLGLIP